MKTIHSQLANRPSAGRAACCRLSCRRSRAAIALAGAMTLAIGLVGCWDDSSNAPAGASAAPTYSIGGSIAGLTTAGLVLANGGDTASPAAGATSFSFPTPLASGSSYGVTVQAQPASATCVVSGGSGTVASTAVNGIAITCTPGAFTVGGSITGLSAAGLVLANGADTVAVPSGATGFTLPTAVAQGASYAVTVRTQPAGEHCSLTASSGSIAGANVTNVAVACAAASHSLGGTISGLPSSGLVLANGSDTVSPAAGALAFTFATPVAEGGAYAVSVRTQPPGATCSIGSGTGTMGTSDVATVQVTCAANAYHLSGTIAGLTASGLILANGSDTVSPPTNATSFAFARTVAFGGTYSVTVQQQPAGLACAVAGNFPVTMGAGDVTDLAVTCTPANSLTPLAGQLACPNSGPYPDGSGTNASLPGVFAMGSDAAGNLFAGGFGAVREISKQGVVTTLAGQVGSLGAMDGTGPAARFAGPEGVAVDNQGNLLVGDGGRIRQITPQGVVSTIAGSLTLAGFADGSGSNARFTGAAGVAIDTLGNLYVADATNNAIRKVTSAGVVTTLAGNGASGFVDGTGAAARFNLPIDVAIDAAGNLYVSDAGNNAIRKITPAGVVTTLAGGGPTNPGFVDGVGSAARFKTTERLVLGTGGNLYVADQQFSAASYSGGEALRVVDSSTGQVTTLAVTSDYTANHPSPVPSSASIALPPSTLLGGMGINAQGKLFVSIGCSVQQVGP
jgi:NHL repeat